MYTCACANVVTFSWFVCGGAHVHVLRIWTMFSLWDSVHCVYHMDTYTCTCMVSVLETFTCGPSVMYMYVYIDHLISVY